MDVEPSSLEIVSKKIKNQSAISACFGATLWSIFTLALWYFVYLYFPQFSTMMLVLNGAVIGLAARFHGRGLSSLFSLIALTTHTWISYLALSLGIVFNGTTWGVILLGCYVMGAIFSITLSRINIPFEDHRAHSQLNILNKRENKPKLYNQWFVVMPILLLILAGSSFITSSFIYVYSEDVEVARKQSLKNKLTNKEIDITPQGLKDLKSRDILIYSYAYHTGILFNSKGTGSQAFVKSKYKSKILLKYLIDQRNNLRAKFIFGHLMNDAAGDILVKEAAKEGDKYAQVYSLIDYGCTSDANKAKELLSDLSNRTPIEYIQEEIESVLYFGFPDACLDDDEHEYLLSHILNYKE